MENPTSQFNYATGYALKARHLFTRFDLEKFQTADKSKMPDRRFTILNQIFIYFMQLIINDVIDNNITFRFPKYFGIESFIEMDVVHGEAFAKARQNGAYADINFLKSNFTGSSIVYRVNCKRRSIKFDIKVHKLLKNKIIENVNNGVAYG